MKQFSITTQKLILVHNYVFNYFCKKKSMFVFSKRHSD